MFSNSRVFLRRSLANGLGRYTLLATVPIVSLGLLAAWTVRTAETPSAAVARLRQAGGLCVGPSAFKTTSQRATFLEALYRKLDLASADSLDAGTAESDASATQTVSNTLVSQTPLPGICIPQFAVPLPVFGPAGSIPRVNAARHPRLTVAMTEINQNVLPIGMQTLAGANCPDPPVTLGKTRVWAYATSDTRTGKILGPANWPAVTIEASRGIPNQVTYVNNLPSFNPSNPTGPGLVQGLLLIDQTLHWADPLGTRCGMPVDCTADPNNFCCQPYTGPQPAVPHLHGGEISACYDGGPESWFTPDGRTGPLYCTDKNPGPGKDIYTYQNSQEPGTLWFHDHTLGATQTVVNAGLAGFYFLHASLREPRKLPSGRYEIEMAIQDRYFDTNSQLMDQTPPTLPTAHPFWVTRFKGDVATVNGAAWPFFKVEPRRYRFRMLNGTAGRRLALDFGNSSASEPTPTVWQIGADDNYFDRPVQVNGTACAGGTLTPCSDLFLMPGERADVIVDFTGLAGKTITLINRDNFDTSLPNIMQFRVTSPLKGRDLSCNPARPIPALGVCARPVPSVSLTDGKGNLASGVVIDKTRQFAVMPTDDGDFVNNTKWNGLLSPNVRQDFPLDGVSELPQVGSTELWEFINMEPVGGGPGHPIHTHLAQFQILNRQNFDVDPTNGYTAAYDSSFGGPGSSPLPAPCTPGTFCPEYGPPLDYLTPNADNAYGGNPAVSPYLHDAQGNPTPIIPPAPGESGWKDDADLFPGQVLRIVVRWTPTTTPVIPNKSYAGKNLYSFDPTQGYYAVHCHFIGHEDNEMMRPYKVVK